ncbi:MAG: hypothetical protein GWO24_20025 [Akkermansiaceae bacterium]|nr:hypothetical protein [Akkermansiaceae bacterium]
MKSVQNARPFEVAGDRLREIRTGYRLSDPTAGGHVLSHKISLPGKEMKISCDVSSGSIAVSLFDEEGKLITTSKPIAGGRGLRVREPVTWPAGFKLDPHVSRPVSLRIDLTGDAKLFALRFDQLFWE